MLIIATRIHNRKRMLIEVISLFLAFMVFFVIRGLGLVIRDSPFDSRFTNQLLWKNKNLSILLFHGYVYFINSAKNFFFEYLFSTSFGKYASILKQYNFIKIKQC